MKQLKKMLLINWHYINKQTIEFDNINFLTGKNGAGKSTILDALQLLILGDTRGTFFNKAANDKAGRSLEGYLKGEIGDDGDAGYTYKRNSRFSTYIVCEFLDKVTKKSFCLGVIFDVYKESDIENHFFSIQGTIPQNEFIDENEIPFSYRDLKSFLTREYGTKNFEFYASNKQYQDAERGKLGGLNQKFFNLFKKAVTFTPIDDIEKFIVEYVCDVKNKIDITSMQENIRQYNELSKQVELMKTKEKELTEIQQDYNEYMKQIEQERQEQYLIKRAEKQIDIEQIEQLEAEVKVKTEQAALLEKNKQELKAEQNKLDTEIEELIAVKAKSDIDGKVKALEQKIAELKGQISNIENMEKKDIIFFRNNTLKWSANISKLEQIKGNIVADEWQELGPLKDEICYLESIHEENFESLELDSLQSIKDKIYQLIKLGNTVYYATKQEKQKDVAEKKTLQEDIYQLKKGVNPHKPELIRFKQEIETCLKERTGKKVEIAILEDVLEIKNIKWQNAIEGYLNTQKKYLVIEPEFFEEASQIYQELARQSQIHSFGIVDIGKIQKERVKVQENSLATEVVTENALARTYIDYLIGNVIKCETVQELRNYKTAITADCMLYQGYVLRKINPKTFRYPSIGKGALARQKEIKEKELNQLEEKMQTEDTVLQVMEHIKEMTNFSENDMANVKNDVEISQKKKQYRQEKEALQKELDSIDMFWLNQMTNQIAEKTHLRDEKNDQMMQNTEEITRLKKDIETNLTEKIPELQEKLRITCQEIEENYSAEWQEQVGEPKYGKEALKKTANKIFESVMRSMKARSAKKDEAKMKLEDKRSCYNTKYQLSYNIHDGSNQEFTDELKQLQEIQLPDYLEKIEDSREKAYEQFRIQFLDKLKSNIEEVKAQIKELNMALGAHRFGTDSYSFKVSPKQEHKRFYDMITDNLLLGDWGIAQEQFQQKYSQEMKELFDKVTTTDCNSSLISDEEYEKNIKEYTDYRTYLNFDLVVKNQAGNEQRLSKTLLKKSGGETQTPFYISILASFAQVYRIQNNENTIRLIVFDEAFSKMDSERIEESIKLLKKTGFQAIFAAPPDKLQDIQSLVDSTLLVLNPEEHEIVVRKYTNKMEW